MVFDGDDIELHPGRPGDILSIEGEDGILRPCGDEERCIQLLKIKMPQPRAAGGDRDPYLSGSLVPVPDNGHPVISDRHIRNTCIGDILGLLPVEDDRCPGRNRADVQAAGLRLPRKGVVTATPAGRGTDTGGAGIDLKAREILHRQPRCRRILLAGAPPVPVPVLLRQRFLHISDAEHMPMVRVRGGIREKDEPHPFKVIRDIPIIRTVPCHHRHPHA